MKVLYPICRVALPLLIFLLLNTKSTAQCAHGDPGGTTAFDTTIAFGTGVTATPVKFPQFNPINGMVTCVRLCITITGVIDTLSIENLSTSPQVATFTYDRSDEITGPGLITPLSNDINVPFGPYPLTGTDHVSGSGTDRIAFGRDTVLNEELCRTISDSLTIASFYGLDSVTYNYTIDVTANANVTGGSAAVLVLTSALVNFHFEYCTCPPLVLPLNIQFFAVQKVDAKVELKWSGYDDPYENYYYEAEVSRDSRNFSSIGSLPKNTTNSDAYRISYTAPNDQKGTYYFRVKQVYANGYVRYSNIKQVVMESSASFKFSVYPNPSSGIVGIKFDNIMEGQFDIQIYNTQGQTIVQKEIVLNGQSSMQVTTLKSGVYWVRLTDKKTQSSSVNQILIK